MKRRRGEDSSKTIFFFHFQSAGAGAPLWVGSEGVGGVWKKPRAVFTSLALPRGKTSQGSHRRARKARPWDYPSECTLKSKPKPAGAPST